MKQRLPVFTSPRGTRGLDAAELASASSTEAHRRCTASSWVPLRGLRGVGAACSGFMAALPFTDAFCTKTTCFETSLAIVGPSKHIAMSVLLPAGQRRHE